MSYLLIILRSIGSTSAFILALFLAACAQVPKQEAIAPFTTDGCSLFPNHSQTTKKDWCDCCVAHDRAYWRGGTADQRLAADQTFKACIEAKTSNPTQAALMYEGVRLGGTPYLNTPFRWGYGWSFGRGYAPLSDQEMQDAANQEAEYLAKHAVYTCPK